MTAAIRARFDFDRGDEGWSAGFSDYPAADAGFYELEAGVRALPGELGRGRGFMLSGNNHSDDLFMFLKRGLGPSDGLTPDTAYGLHFIIRVASNAATDAFGVGGGPGHVRVPDGRRTPVEPVVIDDSGDLRMNVDKGEQAGGGPAASTTGNVANGRSASDPPLYVSVVRRHVHTEAVRTGADTDSGFEGTTKLYYQTVEVELVPA